MVLKFHRFVRKITLAGAAASAAAILFSPVVQAQDAGTNEEGIEEVMVTGFRESLEAALNLKRSAANNTESIVAEDIGKMPDLNLAESIQRVPGVAISREGGEGRQVTVRGLGPDFTRTTLNGMEVPSSAGGLDSSGGVNRSRSFDFNIFASELFNRINIHKTPKASTEEGGLASTVELYTPKPLDNPGLQLSVAGQAAIDNLAGETDPRITALVSNTFLDDTLGVLLSFASTERHVQQEGFGTVRWSSPASDGLSWADTTGTVVNGTATVPLDELFLPRLPRMDIFNNEIERTGFTAAVQFRPSDVFEIGLDVVASEYESSLASYNYFAQFRNEWDSITPQTLTLDPSGRYVTAGTFTGLQTRSESRGQFSTVDFLQTVVSGTYSFSDNVKLDFLVGNATSEHSEDQYRYNLNSRTDGGLMASGTLPADYFEYSFLVNSNIAEMAYGFDILDPNNYQFSGDTTRRDIVERTNDTMSLDLEIDADTATIRTGLIFNTREVDSTRWDPILIADGGTYISDNPPISAVPGLAIPVPANDFAEGIGAPAGFPRNWLVNDFDATILAYNSGIPSVPFERNPIDGATFNIEEKTTGGYVELDVETELMDKPLRINTGVRVVQTETTGSGAVFDSTGTPLPVTQTGNYSDVLPATNIVWEVQDDLLLRLNLARNLTRPGLSSLSPTITAITPVAGTISRGNPDLDPIRADSADLSAEWYFAEESLLAFTLFNKSISGFIIQDTVVGPLSPELQEVVRITRPETDPSSPAFDTTVTQLGDDWEISQPVNGENSTLNGYEIAYQQPFTNLPGILSNFGVLANYTHVNTDETEGLSEDSYNFALYYETDVFGARITVNSRDDYITRINGRDGNLNELNTGPTRMDLSAFYNLTDQITFTLEVINLNEEEERNYTNGPEGDLNLVREFNTTGREVYLGVRADFF